MKLLIGYDGSRCSEAALDDLQKAGLPETCEALIVSVAEIWLRSLSAENKKYAKYAKVLPESKQAFNADKKNDTAFSEAETFACHAQKRLQKNFPDWKISTRSTNGSPACEILRCAEDFEPDLIVVGSHGHSAVNHLLMGSISQKVLAHARCCSVRVARGRIEVDPFPVRIMIGFDGSEGSKEAVKAVISRHWSESAEIRLVAATDLIVPTAIGRFTLPVADWVNEEMKSVEEWIEKLAENELLKLRDAGFSATLHTYPGNPKQVLVEQAQNWDADCIFIGATAFPRRAERFLLGSTSAAVAERAHCSVEVIRKKIARNRNIKKG